LAKRQTGLNRRRMKIAEEFQGRRATAWLPVLDRADSLAPPDQLVQRADDAALLDAYSQTVSGVVENARDAVVNIRVRQAGHNGGSHRGEGSGSGFIITPRKAASGGRGWASTVRPRRCTCGSPGIWD